PPPAASSPPPEIPGPGQIKCRLCGITVSCKKIANLTAHALKIHTPVPLWKCPKSGCEFDHADFTRVSLNKHSIEDHVKTMHTSGRPFQCGICKYTSVEEWKVRVHASIRHPETSCLQMLTVASHNKPHLYIRELFPDIAALLPEDEVDEMLYGFRQLNPSVLLSVPSPLNSQSDCSEEKTTINATSSVAAKSAKNELVSHAPFTLNGTNLSECSSYVYLRREINMLNDLVPELSRRKRAACGAFKSIEYVVKRRKTTRLRADLLDSKVLPALTNA
ncbi:unnamed protein product, partial [Angiostrongylus costaricensis]|uniref:C2H2-type domain-containing protein n=1 Tax=Angiostrongylus costaricensis TaxID=334426 RepID=A0A0R3PEQ1_ANGCS